MVATACDVHTKATVTIGYKERALKNGVNDVYSTWFLVIIYTFWGKDIKWTQI